MLSKPSTRLRQSASIDFGSISRSEQIADGVGVLSAVEPMNRHAPGIRIGHRRRIQRPLNVRRHRGIDVFARTRRAGRWHFLRTELARDLLPGLGVLPDLGQVEGVNREAGGFALFVMTSYAVLRHNGSWRGYFGGRGAAGLGEHRRSSIVHRPSSSHLDRPSSIVHRRCPAPTGGWR